MDLRSYHICSNKSMFWILGRLDIKRNNNFGEKDEET